MPPALTDPAYHRLTLLLTLLTRAQAQMDALALLADRDWSRPCGAEVLGEMIQIRVVLREMEPLLQQALADASRLPRA